MGSGECGGDRLPRREPATEGREVVDRTVHREPHRHRRNHRRAHVDPLAGPAEQAEHHEDRQGIGHQRHRRHQQAAKADGQKQKDSRRGQQEREPLIGEHPVHELRQEHEEARHRSGRPTIPGRKFLGHDSVDLVDDGAFLRRRLSFVGSQHHPQPSGAVFGVAADERTAQLRHLLLNHLDRAGHEPTAQLGALQPLKWYRRHRCHHVGQPHHLGQRGHRSAPVIGNRDLGPQPVFQPGHVAEHLAIDRLPRGQEYVPHASSSQA